jgi:carboxyl-terminal processing protease
MRSATNKPASVRVAVITAIISIVFTTGLAAAKGGGSGAQTGLKAFREAFQIVQRNYVKDVSQNELSFVAIKGMLTALDPDSFVITKAQREKLKEQSKQEFSGLGIEIAIHKGELVVITPIEGTPADKAGIKPGDRIIKIDGEPLKDPTLIDVVRKLRGPRGSSVTVTVDGESRPNPVDITITRDKIRAKPVTYSKLEDGYAYLKPRNFAKGASKAINNAIKDLGGNAVKGMILDLRNNSGGLLDETVNVASLFTGPKLITQTKGRLKNYNKDYKGSGKQKHLTFKLAVLVNKGTSSGSELIAAALQEYDRALIFGQKTFGKGSVQSLFKLSSGDNIRLTTAYFYTPEGRNLHGAGLLPDVPLKKELDQWEKMRAEAPGKLVDLDEDPVVAVALDWLKSTDSVAEFKQSEDASKPGSLGALKSLMESAKKGDKEAQYELGIMYRDGKGVPRDKMKAGIWLYRAADQGHKKAKEELKKAGYN